MISQTILETLEGETLITLERELLAMYATIGEFKDHEYAEILGTLQTIDRIFKDRT